MPERTYREIAMMGSPEATTFSPGGTYHRPAHRSRQREDIAVVVHTDHTTWVTPGLRSAIGWRARTPFSHVEAEASIAQTFLDHGYRVRIERYANAVAIYVRAEVTPRRLF